MRAIQEIISLLQELGLTSAKDFTFPFKNHSQARDFFRLLKEHPVQDDEAAAMLFFNKPANARPYLRAKRKLFEQLVRAVFLIDTNRLGETPYQRAYYECWKNICAAKILLGRSAHQSALKALKSVLHQSEKYSFTQLAAECCQLLRWYHACMDGNGDKYRKNHERYQQYLKTLQAEQLAEEYYTHISSIYLTDKSQSFFLAQLADGYWEEIRGLMQEHDSHRLHFIGHLLHVFSHACAGQYDRALKADEQAIAHFEKKGNGMERPAITFLNHQLSCCIKLKNTAKGKDVIARLEMMLKSGTFDWFVYRNLAFLFYLHAGRYQEARITLEGTVKERAFKNLPRPQMEKWRVNRAYIYLLETTGCLEPRSENLRVFPMKAFLKSVPLFSRDKRGMNVPILIVQFLILLAEKKRPALIDRVEALKKYTGRYLRSQDAYRSNCFLKMLAAIPDNGFNLQRIHRKVKPLEEKLARTPMEVSTQAFELEVIPYEELWKLAVRILGG